MNNTYSVIVEWLTHTCILYQQVPALYLNFMMRWVKCSNHAVAAPFHQTGHESVKWKWLSSFVSDGVVCCFGGSLLFLISLWSPASVNMSDSSTPFFPMNPQSPLFISPSPNIIALFWKTGKYCFPETLLREELLSLLFIRILAAVHGVFYVKRGRQHAEEMWSIVWFSASFCSTPVIISCLLLW